MAESGHESSTGAGPLQLEPNWGCVSKRRGRGRVVGGNNRLSPTLSHQSRGRSESSPMRLTRKGEKLLSEVLGLKPEGEGFLGNFQILG